MFESLKSSYQLTKSVIENACLRFLDAHKLRNLPELWMIEQLLDYEERGFACRFYILDVPTVDKTKYIVELVHEFDEERPTANELIDNFKAHYAGSYIPDNTEILFTTATEYTKTSYETLYQVSLDDVFRSKEYDRRMNARIINL